ncbi:AAA family ATPase [Synechococcus sp. CCY 0621]|uniref:AAA family ATPase n=1 Tax=Synechococcus sp. CCY 0621 TaxID=2815603 RepID=UPI001C22BD04|nr:AAA family ATPase [Synechococcus sp. CCY 0621]
MGSSPRRPLEPSPHPSLSPQRVTDDLDRLLAVLPPVVQRALAGPEQREGLLEVVLDLGRVPEARYPGRVLALGGDAIERSDLAAVLQRLGPFGGDNRAGIERTLHRISAIRNRTGDVVGLTCRVGRAVFGTVAMVRDLLDTGQSLLLMGRPGVGKTTALREIARVLADDLQRRVVVIDTSNEIAGDGDIPHPAIGRARRMQVARPELQHQVMIEAVENHMPEVIVIDEIGTELEAQAARTIAERGVMLVATAHGNELANLIRNPTLSDLVGGIQSVTLGDEEARRRRTQKTVLERAAEPTFPLAVEMHSRHRWLVHRDVAGTVDLLLRGQPTHPQARELGSDGRLLLREDGPVRPAPPPAWATAVAPRRPGPAPLAVVPLPDPTAPRPVAAPALRIYGVGVAAQQLEEAVRRRQLPVEVVEEPEQADALLSVRGQLGRDPELRRQARDLGLPILVIKSDTPHQLQRAMERLLERRQGGGGTVDGEEPVGVGADRPDDAHAALEECRLAVEQVVLPQGRPVELLPRSEAVRALQAELVHHYRLRSAVFGRGRQQRLRVFPA